jgi:hypothetical protein
MVQIVDNLSHQAGAHALRAGADFIFNDDTITYPRAVRGSYTFPSLPAFLAGTYSGFTQTFGDAVVAQTNPNVGVYVQDEWSAAAGLTLNLGLRYDLQFLHAVNTDSNNLSPRAGVAWSPPSHRSWLIRGSAGLFFDRVPLRAVANAILSAGNTTDAGNLHQPSVSNIVPTQAGAPAFPDILPARVLTTTLVDFTTMDRNLRNAYSKQASVEVERSLGHGRTVSVGYLYLRGSNLLMSVNQNVPTCAAAGTNNGCRPNPAYRNNNQYSSVGESNYHGLHVSLVQRPSEWASLRVSYTLSKSMNDLGEAFFSSPIDPTDISRDWGGRRRPAAPPRDRRHDEHVDGAGDDDLGAPEPRVPGERHTAVLLVAAVQRRVGCGQHAGDGEPAAGRWRYGAAELRRAVRRVRPAERGDRQRFLHVEPACEPHVPHRQCGEAGRARRSLQHRQPRQQPDQEQHLGPWRLSPESRAGVQHDHGGRGSALASVRRASDVLTTRRNHRRRIASEKKPAALATWATARSAPTGRPAAPRVLTGHASRLP